MILVICKSQRAFVTTILRGKKKNIFTLSEHKQKLILQQQKKQYYIAAKPNFMSYAISFNQNSLWQNKKRNKHKKRRLQTGKDDNGSAKQQHLVAAVRRCSCRSSLNALFWRRNRKWRLEKCRQSSDKTV